MTQQEPTEQQVLFAQLPTENFNDPDQENNSSEDERDSDVPLIVPANTDSTADSHFVRVTRPTQPTDFILQRPLTNEKDLLNLAFRPAALNTRVTCRIHRCRDGLDKLYPQYHLFIEHLGTGEIQHVMTARKKRKSNTSYYTITGIYRENTSVPEGYLELGKVR
ncbi:hypothetical protein BDF20DRAFT_826111 [Mycotypha africana]|uniref:uncharacterized protein n=1 Tax=Mycotypha africana TaxID=64632 RepID=UPI002301F1B2|nr:uncharacterized protein BDF20DRAFT_826111 [Mycotypha africana]KAI8970436.1 hypothetical protein BDF20DRAFT_826111 [Mycotypha africana]